MEIATVADLAFYRSIVLLANDTSTADIAAGLNLKPHPAVRKEHYGINLGRIRRRLREQLLRLRRLHLIAMQQIGEQVFWSVRDKGQIDLSLSDERLAEHINQRNRAFSWVYETLATPISGAELHEQALVAGIEWPHVLNALTKMGCRLVDSGNEWLWARPQRESQAA